MSASSDSFDASPAELARYLHSQIPLSKAMGVAVLSIEPDALVLQAPLPPNINHHHTVFGGSASTLATLAAWSLLHTRLQREGIANRLVIRHNTMAYEQPMRGDFSARATLAEPARWPAFIEMLARKGKARISVVSVLECHGHAAGRFTGEFVALAGA